MAEAARFSVFLGVQRFDEIFDHEPGATH